MNFSVEITDAQGRVCQQTARLAITGALPFDCLGIAQNVNDAIWTIFPNTNHPPCTHGTLVNGASADWQIYVDGNPANAYPGGCYDPGGFYDLRWDTQICNPGAAYDLTLRVPYDTFGNIWVGDGDLFQATLQIGANFQQASGKITSTIPYSPLTCVVSLPANTISNVTVLLHSLFVPFPIGSGAAWINSAGLGNLTVTPLFHP